MTSRKHTRIKVGAITAALIATIFSSFFIASQPAQASSDEEVMKKALAGAMEMCYRNRDSAFKSSINTSEYFYVDNVVNAWGSYIMPTDIGNKMGTTAINCREVFIGVRGGILGTSAKLQGILSRFGKNESSVTPEDLGYVDETESSTSQAYTCFNLTYSLFSSSSDFTKKTSNKVCFPTDANGRINIDNPQNVKTEDDENVTSEQGSLELEYDPSTDCIHYSAMNPPAGESWGQGTGYGCFAWGVDGKTPSEVVSAMNNGAAKIVANKGLIGAEGSFSVYHAHEPQHTPKASQSPGQNSLSATMVLDNGSSKRAMDWLKGGTDGYTGMTFGPDDWAYIYTTYIKRLRQSGQISVNNDCTTDKNKFTYAVTSDNGTTWCEVLGAENVTEQFAGQSGNSNKLLELMSFTKILEKYIRLNFANVDSGTTSGVVGGDDSSGNPGESGEISSITACYESAGILGWIACPVLEVMSGVTETLYGFIEDRLSIGSELMGSEGIRSGWSIFRDFSNIIFAIVFILVILSQLTGIGISNYGIKKILPRLIVVVVLVNISFILCQLAVDVSNILGSNLRAIFDGFSETVAKDVGGIPFNLGTVVGGLAGTTVAVGGAVVITAVLAITIPFQLWLFPIFLAIIGCVVSVLFFFILLGVRQAGIVVLITLAPVAIVCYALPNTKSLFDRWKKMFTALLLVYPICGLLMGGGTFASTLLMSVAHEGNASGFFVIIAMLINVAPFFMIPSILRSSMTAMGNLGVKVSQFGSRIGGGITRGIRNSEVGKDIQRRANMSYADRAASKIERSQKGLAGKIKPLRERNQKRLGRFNAMYNRYSYEDIRAGGAATRIKPGTAMYEALEQGQKSKQFEEDVAGRQELLKNGTMSSKLPGGGTISGNDEDGMIAELDGYLERIIDGANSGKTATDLEDDVKNAQAIMNTLSATGKGSTMGRVENSFARVMHNKQSTLTSATGDVKTTLAKTFGSLGARTMNKFGKDYKKNSPGAAALFGDISKGEFSRANTFRLVDELENDGSFKLDRSGNRVQHFASSYYSGSGLSGINPEDLSKMKPHHLSNILDGIEHGDIKGSNALDIAHAADEMLSHPEQFAADADARAYIERIRSATLSSGYTPTGGTRTTGAMAIGRADLDAINGVLNSIQGAQNWSSLSAAEKTRYGQLVSNIHDSLNTDMHTSESAQQLKQALSIAKSKGFIDPSTHAVVDEFTGMPTLKITRNTRQKVAMPAGWARGTDGKWYDGGMTGRQLNATEIVKAEQIERHNNQIDIDNGTV